MSKEVRDLIRDTVLKVRDDIGFYYARESDFNSIKGKNDIQVLLKPLKFSPIRAASGYTTNRSYTVTMLFYSLDSVQDSEEYTQYILDSTEEILTQFMALLNGPGDSDSDLNLTVDTITISAESVTERIKFTSDCVTGWEYNFTLDVPDQFDYCDLG